MIPEQVVFSLVTGWHGFPFALSSRLQHVKPSITSSEPLVSPAAVSRSPTRPTQRLSLACPDTGWRALQICAGAFPWGPSPPEMGPGGVPKKSPRGRATGFPGELTGRCSFLQVMARRGAFCPVSPARGQVWSSCGCQVSQGGSPSLQHLGNNLNTFPSAGDTQGMAQTEAADTSAGWSQGGQGRGRKWGPGDPALAPKRESPFLHPLIRVGSATLPELPQHDRTSAVPFSDGFAPHLLTVCPLCVSSPVPGGPQ